MSCEECVLLLSEYNEESRRYQRAVAAYEQTVARGFQAETEAARRELDEARSAVRRARELFQEHKAAHPPHEPHPGRIDLRWTRNLALGGGRG